MIGSFSHLGEKRKPVDTGKVGKGLVFPGLEECEGNVVLLGEGGTESRVCGEWVYSVVNGAVTRRKVNIIGDVKGGTGSQDRQPKRASLTHRRNHETTTP